MKHLVNQNNCFRVDVPSKLYWENQRQMYDVDPLIKEILNNIEDLEEWEEEVNDCLKELC